MSKLAFVGFTATGDDLPTLQVALRAQFGNVEVADYPTIDEAAAWLVTPGPGGALTGSGNILCLYAGMAPEQVARAERLKTVQLGIIAGLPEYQPGRSNSDITSWLRSKSWPTGEPTPTPQPAPVAEAEDSDGFSGFDQPEPAWQRQPQAAAPVPPPAPVEPTPAPTPAPSAIDRMAEQYARPPMLDGLSPEDQTRQSTVAVLQQQYGGPAKFQSRRAGRATIFYVTGSHGGAGKTTMAWLGANTVANALKRAGKDDVPVWLIEADYRNSKLAQRLDLAPENDSGQYAQFLEKLAAERANMRGIPNMADLHAKVINECVYVEPSNGVRIVACPYDITDRRTNFIRLSIQKIVEFAERQGGYIFIDADTLSNDDILDRNLASKAHHVVLVTDVGHLDDMRRSGEALITPQNENGLGVDKARISVFYNRTTHEEFKANLNDALPFTVDGFVPQIDQMKNGWVGAMKGDADFTKAVVHVVRFISSIEPMDELEVWQHRKISTTPSGGGLLRWLRRRR